MLDDVTDQDLRAGKNQVALELIGLDTRTELVQRLALPRCAHAAGIHFRPGVLQTDYGVARIGQVEKMQVEAARQFIAYANTPHTVAMHIQSRRKNPDA